MPTTGPARVAQFSRASESLKTKLSEYFPSIPSRTAAEFLQKAPHLMAEVISPSFCIEFPFLPMYITILIRQVNSRQQRPPGPSLPATAGGLPPAGSQASTTFDPLLSKLLAPENQAESVPFARLIMREPPSRRIQKMLPRQWSLPPRERRRLERSWVVQTQSIASIPQSRCPAPPESSARNAPGC